MKQKGLDEVRKTKRQWIRAMLSIAVSMLLVLSGLPMEGLREAYAAPIEIKVKEFRIDQKMASDGETVTETILQLVGENLGGIKTGLEDIKISNGSETFMPLKDIGVKCEPSGSDIITITTLPNSSMPEMNLSNNGTTEILLSAKDGFSLTTHKYSFEMKMPKIKPISLTKDKNGKNQSKLQYKNEELKPPLILEGENLENLKELKIGVTSIKYSPVSGFLGKQIKVEEIPLNASGSTIILNKVIEESGGKPKISFTRFFEDYIELANRLKDFDKLDIRPTKGKFDKENRFDIFVYKKKPSSPPPPEPEYIPNETINLEGMKVWIDGPIGSKDRKKEEAHIINKQETNQKQIEVLTKSMPKPSSTPPGGKYKYNIIIEAEDGSKAVLETDKDGKEGVYELSDSILALKLDDAVNTETNLSAGNNLQTDLANWEKVKITGTNIIHLNTAYYDLGTESILPKTIQRKGDKLIVKYDVSKSNDVAEITREITLTIGMQLIPIGGDEDIRNVSNKEEEDTHFSTLSKDGVFFMLPESVEAGKKDVIITTNTKITYKPGASDKKIRVPDMDIKKEGFTYKKYPVVPEITEITPAYGYYNDYFKYQKPLVLRFKGSDFKVLLDSQGKPQYPTVEFFDRNNNPLNDVVKIIGKKVLDDKDAEVQFDKKEAIGSQYVVEVQLSPNALTELKERVVKAPLSSGNYQDFPVSIRIKNPDTGSSTFDKKGKNFSFRYPLPKDDAEKYQPKIIGLYDKQLNKLSTNRFNSNIKNEVYLKVSIPDPEPINEWRFFLDGKEIKVGQDKNSRRPDPDISATNVYVFKIDFPENLSGDMKFQIIGKQGLMDSVDVSFTQSKGPWLKQIVPSKGPKGTWILIERDTTQNISATFRKPDPNKPGDKGSIPWLIDSNGNQIPITEFRVKNQNLIEARIPETLPAGASSIYTIEVENPVNLRSNGLPFNTLKIEDSLVKIGRISPNKSSPKGGIWTTITAAEGTFFAKPDGQSEEEFKVYFDNVVVEGKDKVKLSIDKRNLYVLVPPLTMVQLKPGEPPYKVRVTVQNVNGATDSVKDGFEYGIADYQDKENINIIAVFKNEQPVDESNNKGKEGEEFVVRGTGFRAVKVIKNGKTIFELPTVKFGYEDAEILEPRIDSFSDSSKGYYSFNKLVVRVPKEPENVKSNGAVDVSVINQDFGWAEKKDAFIYTKSKPKIRPGYISRANRLGEYLFVTAEDVYKNGLMVAFGNDKTVYDQISIGPDTREAKEIEFENAIGDIRVVYQYKDQGDTVQLLYKDPIKQDWKPVEGASFRLDQQKPKKTFRIPWKNYPLKEETMPSHLKARLNDEWVYVQLDLSPSKEKLIVRRMLGKVIEDKFKVDEKGIATVYFETPYHKLDPKSNITLINADGSDTGGKDPFEFHGYFDTPSITDINGSEEKTVTIDKVKKLARVYETSYDSESVITIKGTNLKDIEYIMIGDIKTTQWSPQGQKNEEITVRVPKGKVEDVDKLKIVQVITKAGIAFSDKAVPPVYFKFIHASSKPVIESVKPDLGPRTGGTKVVIVGAGFKDTDQFGNKVIGDKSLRIEVDGISVPAKINSNEKGEILSIEAFIPKSKTPYAKGKVDLVVINADKGKSDPADFTYISQPEIKKVKSLSTIDEAGENWVEVTGEDFQEGAKVYIGGQLKKYGKKPEKATASGMGKAVDGKNTVNYLIGGTEVKDVEVKGPNLLRFKLPKDVADIQADKVTILNPDTGISEPKEFSPFDVPLIAELVPNKGPVGSFVWIKGDPAGQPFQYQNPPFTKVRWKGEKNTGGIILPAEVKDAHNILIRVPHEWSKGQKIEPGEYEISVINTLMENGKKVEKESPSMFFEVIKTDDEIELASIDPTKGDIAGGIPATIKAKKGKFSADDKVYFGSQEASIAGMNPAGNELYVIVPKLTEKIVKKGESLPVTVTVQKKSGATGSLIDGFVYYNTGDSEKVQITAIYKHGTTEKTKTGKGHPKDIFWIEGNHFLIRTEGTPEKVAYPDIYIGFEKAEVLGDYLPPEVKNGRILNKIPIRIPERTKFKDTAGQNNNTVDVTLINPDGSSAVLKDGFTYLQDRPAILTKDLEASRFDGKIKVETEHMPQDNYVIFGEDAKNPDRFGLGIREEQFTTKHSEIEKVVIKYLGPEKGKDNFEIYYQNPDGSLLLMGDATDGGRITLQKPGDRKLVKINWKNPDYHKNTKIAQNPNLLNKIHDEYMLLERIQDNNHEMQILQVRRGIGVVDSRRVTDPQKSRATLMISTPYHERAEKTTMTIVGKNDESLSAEAPIRFTEPLIGEMEITDIEDSVLTKIDIDGKPVEAKVKKININQTAIVKVYGKKFGDKETTKVTVGVQGDAVKVNLLEIGANEDYMILELPKVPDALRNKPLSVDVFSKNGNDFSSKKKPPIYLMFVQGAPGPDNLKIDPAKGPRTGGTRVTITGKGFKEMDSVGVPGSIKYSLDGERALPVSRVVKDTKGNITALEIVMPARKVGEARLQIINADGGVSPIQKFQYISQPQISNVSGSVFAKEGTEIRVSGYDFQPGAKVTISGKLEPIKDGEGELMKGVVAGKNQYFKITGGTAISDVTVEGGNIIKFKLPKRESAENNNIIIQNPDGGVTDIGSGKIAPPIPEVPVITASPGAEGSVILSWKVDQDTLNKAKKFEIYAKLSGDSEYTFVGDTMQNKTNQAFVVKGLEHDQNYDFKVRVLNDTGEAKDFGIVHGFTLSAADDYKEEEKQQEVDRMVKKIETQGKQEIVGNVVRYTVGSGDSVVDLSKHTKYKNKQVQIPAWELKNHRGKTLHIIDGNMNLRVSYASLFTPELAAASSDALVRIHIASADSKKEGALRKAIGRNKSRLSPIYKVDFEVVDPKKTQKIKQLAGRANIGISASKGQAGYIAIYVEAEDKFQKLPNAAISKGGYYVLLRDKNE